MTRKAGVSSKSKRNPSCDLPLGLQREAVSRQESALEEN
jgi:hypothetical protein